MTKLEERQLFDINGEPVELNDVQRVNLVCFKCTNYIEDNFGLLLSHMEKESSDNVSERTSVYLCENCYHKVMRFCGSVND